MKIMSLVVEMLEKNPSVKQAYNIFTVLLLFEILCGFWCLETFITISVMDWLLADEQIILIVFSQYLILSSLLFNLTLHLWGGWTLSHLDYSFISCGLSLNYSVLAEGFLPCVTLSFHFPQHLSFFSLLGFILYFGVFGTGIYSEM